MKGQGFQTVLKDRLEGFLTAVLAWEQFEDFQIHFPFPSRKEALYLSIDSLKETINVDLGLNPSDEDIGSVLTLMVKEGTIRIEPQDDCLYFIFKPTD